MTKLLITEITRMGPAFCVIGLQRDNQKILSIRPIPSSAVGWMHFPHHRGDILEFSLAPFPGDLPHVEDRIATRDFRKSAAIAEPDVAGYLRRAECADSLPGLFECSIHENRHGSGSFAFPGQAKRSVCGCYTQNLRIELCGGETRATLVLSSGEVLRDLPVVDRDWLNFIDAALAESRGANRAARLEGFLNSQFHYKIMSCSHHFVRIGLTRPYKDVCWLMLDTLFPLPKAEWLEEF
jgi:hypothetical protein